MSFATWIGVALLGGVGACARFIVHELFVVRFGHRLPIGTFVINISGAFALGLLTGLALTGDALELAGTATLGAYTTFSTWMLETHRIDVSGRRIVAVLYVVLSLVVGVGAAALGRAIGSL